MEIPKIYSVYYNNRMNISIILYGCDSNTHHVVWGHPDTNKKREYLIDFQLETNHRET